MISPRREHTSRQLSKHARAAHDASDGWLWDLAAQLPVLGPNVEAVQVMAHSLDDLAGDPLGDSLDFLSRLQGGEFVPKQGRLDLAQYERAAPMVTRVAAAVDAARARVDAVRPEDLFGPVGAVVSRLQGELTSVDSAAGAARTAVRLVPDMMGGTAPRSILLIVQNNAEIRATAGMPGSFSFLTARDGKLVIGPHYSTSDLPPLRRPAALLTADERRCSARHPATDVRDTTLMPDFPRAAQLLSAVIGRETHRRVDTVVSVDPVALARVLRSTGPIKLGTETFTSDNVVTKLLHEPYQRFPTQTGQNAYFSAAASGDHHDDARRRRRPLETSSGSSTESVAQRRVSDLEQPSREQRLLGSSAITGAAAAQRHTVPHT